MKIADETLQTLATYVVGIYVWLFTVVSICYIAFKVFSTFKNLEILIVVLMAGLPGALYVILNNIFNSIGIRFIIPNSRDFIIWLLQNTSLRQHLQKIWFVYQILGLLFIAGIVTAGFSTYLYYYSEGNDKELNQILWFLIKNSLIGALILFFPVSFGIVYFGLIKPQIQSYLIAPTHQQSGQTTQGQSSTGFRNP